MSRLEVLDLEALRGRLEYAMRFDVAHDGSLYLNVLACVFLACDEQSIGETTMLQAVLYSQAEAEGVEGDDLITRLLMEVPE